jgi:hypothetical protein
MLSVTHFGLLCNYTLFRTEGNAIYRISISHFSTLLYLSVTLRYLTVTIHFLNVINLLSLFTSQKKQNKTQQSVSYGDT